MPDAPCAHPPREALEHTDENRLSPLVARMRALLVADRGFTIDLVWARPVHAGLAVCAEPSRSLRFPFDRWSDRVVSDWLSDITAHVRRSGSRGSYLGGWRPSGSGQVYLDLVRVVPTEARQCAEQLGRAYRQRAMFDLDRRTLVPLRPPAVAAT